MNKQSYSFIRLAFFLLAIIVGLSDLPAKIHLPKLVCDRMVLQRDTELNIWGWADAGEIVTVRFQGKYYDAKPGADGKWMVTLPPQKAGGPFIMEINEIIIRDILIGDVWLCSGQSNMETPIARLVDRFPEINVSNNHMIRYYKVPTQRNVCETQDEIVGKACWHSATASDVMNWTALAYFYAQEAYSHTKIPVGMLVSSLGGSNIESWISQEHLCEFPERLLDRNTLDTLPTATGVAVKLQAETAGEGKWQTMNVPGKWRDNGIKAKGVVWYRKDISLPASMHCKHAKLYLGTLVDSDSAFVNGQFVGRTAYSFPPRKYDIPGGILQEGENTIIVRLESKSGKGEFVPDKPYKLVGDDIEIDLKGEWMYKIDNAPVRAKLLTVQAKKLKNVGSGLYNGMIYPIRNYKVKGVIWYQGESNAGRPQEYSALLQSLITNWRELWNMPKMPFLLVQLPNFMPKSPQPSQSGWAGIREAQFQTAMNVPYTSLAVTYDVGEWNDIHPLNKKEIAHRLFLGARKLVYGERIVSSGPVYKSMKIEGDKIILTFDETGSGLVGKGGPLRHFAIAGKDKKFIWADAVIESDKVIVNSPEINSPIAVRYAWADNPEDANLINKEGLLASPFRTDDW